MSPLLPPSSSSSYYPPGSGTGGEKTIPVLDSERLRRSPTCVIVVGMAGSGKTTLVAQLQRSLDPPPPVASASSSTTTTDTTTATTHSSISAAEAEVKRGKDQNEEGGDGDGDSTGAAATGGVSVLGATTRKKKKKRGYCLNLDPATKLVPYGASIDIRDTVDYKEVMHQHNLGPNGAIMTSLNLFVTKFDQVMGILERRAFGPGGGSVDGDSSGAGVGEKSAASTPSASPPLPSEKILDYILVDTPGQIEAFSWSASGTIISESLASSFPTVLAFVVDTPRCASSPHTFMSNMLYACSMSYRTRLPLVVAFNKTDVVPSLFAEEWMSDYDSFQEALDEAGASSSSSSYNDGGGGMSGYYASLTRSLGLVLDEFYTTLHRVGVSAATGDGVDAFWDAVDRAAIDFEEEYVEDLRDRLAEREARDRAKARASIRRFARDAGEKQEEDEKGVSASVNRAARR